MKYDVTYACGHTETVQLFGPYEERKRKIKWYSEECLCSECYAKKKASKMKNDGFVEKEITYREYKNNPIYSGCKTKADSYNAKEKTIIVYFKEGNEK